MLLSNIVFDLWFQSLAVLLVKQSFCFKIFFILKSPSRSRDYFYNREGKCFIFYLPIKHLTFHSSPSFRCIKKFDTKIGAQFVNVLARVFFTVGSGAILNQKGKICWLNGITLRCRGWKKIFLFYLLVFFFFFSPKRSVTNPVVCDNPKKKKKNEVKKEI